LNLNLTTSDGVILGAWFILSDQHHQSLPLCLGSTPTDRFSNDQIKSALTSHSTIIFFHGNAGTRAVKARVRHYEAFSSRLHSNVLAIDYRGFADSEGSPTEAGLVLDAKAAWDWVIAHGSRPEDVLLMGSSLGTAVAAKLAAELSAQGVIFKGLTMLSPFSSVTALLDTYHILGFLPVVKPLTMIPGADRKFVDAKYRNQVC
jgi:abhydrolase domain-containing protein 12